MILIITLESSWGMVIIRLETRWANIGNM